MVNRTLVGGMELFATAGNPIPSGAIVSTVRTSDGLNLRVARWIARPSRGTVVVAIGRSEFIEQYFEVVVRLLDRGFDAVVMDWRGQGQSDRESRRHRRGHVSSFAGYRRDLEALERQVLKPLAPTPWFAFGHSMGAAILIEQAHDGRSPYERMVLSAPMIGIPLRRKTMIRPLVRLAARLGLGHRLVMGGSEKPVFVLRPFEDNILTSDRAQYERLEAAVMGLPQLAVGAPTYRWLDCAFDLMARFEHPRYAVEVLTPILIIAAGEDRIVDTAATERFAIHLKAGRCITIPNARHQVMMESEAIVAQFWAAFDAFIPGHAAGEHAHPGPVRHDADRRQVRMPRARSL